MKKLSDEVKKLTKSGQLVSGNIRIWTQAVWP